MVLDLIILGIVLLLIIIGIARGIAKTLLNLLSVIAAGFFSYLAAGLAANLVYTAFISPPITSGVMSAMGDSTVSAHNAAQDAIDGLPGFVTGVFNMFGITSEALSKSADTAISVTGATAANAVDTALRPAFVAVLSVVFIAVFFILFLFIFKKVSKKVEKLFHIPVIGFFNKLLGGLLGFLEGCAIVIIGIFVLRISLMFSQDPFITQDMVNSSYIFSAIYNSEILNNIASVIGFGQDALDTLSGAVTTAATEASSN